VTSCTLPPTKGTICLLHHKPFERLRNFNRLTGKSLSKIDNGCSLHSSTDLIPLPLDARVSKPTSTFAQHIHDLHVEIHSANAVSNDSHKLSANVHRRDTYFMTHVQPESLPKHFQKELLTRAMDPYLLIQKSGSNAYVLDLLDNLGISHISNVEDLTLHRDTFEPPCLPLSAFAGTGAPKLPPFPRPHTDIG